MGSGQFWASGRRWGETLKSIVVLLALPAYACSGARKADLEDGGRSPVADAVKRDAGIADAAGDASVDMPLPLQADADSSDAAPDFGWDTRPEPTDTAILDAPLAPSPDAPPDLLPDLVSVDGPPRPVDMANPDARARLDAGASADAPRNTDLPSATFDYFSTCPSTVAKAGDVDVEIFILAGQSNAVGHGRKVQLAERSTRAVPIWAQNEANGWTGAPTRSADTGIMYPIPDACDGTLFAFDPSSSNASLAWEPWLDQIDDPYGPEIAFIAEVQRRMPGHRFVMLKTALGGSNIESDWNPNLRGLIFDALVRQIQAAKASLSANGKTYRFAGFLWMQGENGAASINNWKTKSTTFADLTKQLFVSIRSITDANMPIVVGRIGDQMLADNIINPIVSSSGSKEEIIAATNYRRAEQVRVASEVSGCVWVNTDGLPVLQEGDPALWYHHTSAGELALGERFASAWAALVGR